MCKQTELENKNKDIEKLQGNKNKRTQRQQQGSSTTSVSAGRSTGVDMGASSSSTAGTLRVVVASQDMEVKAAMPLRGGVRAARTSSCRYPPG